MRHIFGENIHINRDCAVAIGKFDGLHKGHMALIAKLKEVAKKRGLAAAVLSFVPHPAAVLAGVNVPFILSPSEKIYVLNQLNLDYFIEYPFTKQFAQISPEDFLKNIVFEQLSGKSLVVGENFRFGKNGAGDAAFAKEIGCTLGLHVHTMALVTQDTAEISAKNIRRAVTAKDFRATKDMCGRNFFLTGEVVHGKKKGREMDFPTANIIPDEKKLLPPCGVYATTTYVDGTAYASVTNIAPCIVETHLLDFCGNLYGHSLRVDFLGWMRDTEKFSSYENLAAQLAQDVIGRRQNHYDDGRGGGRHQTEV